MINSWLFAIAITGAFLLGGCADGAKIVQEHDLGGVVIYPFKEGQGPMLSAFRKEGLDLMNEKCKGRSYSIVREGEAKGRTRVVSPLDGAQELVEERRWGIQFECK
ncbi:conserved exported hypothetical protein [Candidatus Nitrospira nitrosa]|uniref:Uncharacterized protein n=1 Tax=Candidatus Nitrospira nitrosa TaxID=1742972 RepID=A0A0S4LB78_9BACT|nr:hypothetical protein [Candidatus Nitrospira nitrosa]CUS33115.1 conserved exported hypothetical protein [Candidatus Nitrospira nitrosa]